MHRASWRQEIDDRNALTRRAAHVPTPEPIDLPAFVRSTLDGEHGENMESMLTVDGACETVISGIQRRVGRTLTHSERVQVEVATVSARNLRALEAAAYLEDAQRTFASPFSVFARRVG